MRHNGIELVNLKCNLMNIPMVSKVFRRSIENLELLGIHKDYYLVLIENDIKAAIEDEFLSFELRMGD